MVLTVYEVRLVLILCEVWLVFIIYEVRLELAVGEVGLLVTACKVCFVTICEDIWRSNKGTKEVQKDKY